MDQMLFQKTDYTQQELLSDFNIGPMGLSYMQLSFEWPAKLCNLHDSLVVAA